MKKAKKKASPKSPRKKKSRVPIAKRPTKKAKKAPKRIAKVARKKKRIAKKLKAATAKRRAAKRKALKPKMKKKERKPAKAKAKLVVKKKKVVKKKRVVKKLVRKVKTIKKRVVRAKPVPEKAKKRASKIKLAALRAAQLPVKPPRPKRRPLPYSKDQIESLRKQLLEERARLLEELGELDQIAQSPSNSSGSEAPGYSIHPAEYATDLQTMDTALGLRSLAQKSLDEVQQALDGLESGDYGYCESCAKPIEFDRLMAKPSARLCISCRKTFEAGRLA
jgi:DnaK suppressor protein